MLALSKRLNNIPIILGSQSPRRKELLKQLGLNFEVVVKKTAEDFQMEEEVFEIVAHIALAKLKQFDTREFRDSLVITADTIVVYEGQVLGKPKDAEEAAEMLSLLQGAQHKVLTAVAFSFQGKQSSFVEETTVDLYPLSKEEIDFYIDEFRPFDKAGSYGIQEWIGFVGVKAIHGSYENVVGLPTARLYQELKALFI